MNSTRHWLDGLKLRASYGVIGNQNINPYTFTCLLYTSLGISLFNSHHCSSKAIFLERGILIATITDTSPHW